MKNEKAKSLINEALEAMRENERDYWGCVLTESDRGRTSDEQLPFTLLEKALVALIGE